MNNYIIDPQVFYWINTVSAIKIACGIFGGFLCVGGIIAVCGYLYNHYNSIHYSNQTDYVKYMKIARKCAIVCITIGIVFVLGCIFIPDKGTSVEMLISKTATFDNVNWGVEQIKELVDYIIKAIKTI